MLLVFLLIAGTWAIPVQDLEHDGTSSRKILGSSVVTSVSVVMDTGSDPQYTDAVGRPVAKPLSASQLASPINLLNPDRYEFYTFDDSGELVKRLMTLEEIQGIIAANGDGDGINGPSSYNPLSPFYMPEKKVNDVVSNVQNVLKEEMESIRNNSDASRPVLDTPDVSATWSMILPAVFGNSGEDIKLDQKQSVQTPETLLVENTLPPKRETTSSSTEEVSLEPEDLNSGIPQEVDSETNSQASSESDPSSIDESIPLEDLITRLQSEKPTDTPITTTVNLDTPVITVAIVSRKPEISDQILSDSTETYAPLVDEETTNKFLQLFKPQIDATKTSPVLIPVTEQASATTEETNPYLAIFLPPKNEANKNTYHKVQVNKRPVVKPTTFRPATTVVFKTESTRKPSPFRPFSTEEPQLFKKTSASPLNKLPSTLADYIKQKLTTLQPSTNVEVKKQPNLFGTQFVINDSGNNNVLSSTTKRFVPTTTTTTTTTAVPTTTTSTTTTTTTTTTPRPTTTTRKPTTTTTTTTTEKPTTTTTTTTTRKPTTTTTTTTKKPTTTTTTTTTTEPTTIFKFPTTTEELQTSQSNHYLGLTTNQEPQRISLTTQKNKINYGTQYPSTATQILDSINDKVSAVSAVILDRIAATTLATNEEITDESTEKVTTNSAESTTEEENQTNKMTMPEFLDKLLLTSTNIYQINNELIEGTTKLIPTTTEVVETSTNEKSPITEGLTIFNAEETEPNLIASIEELISQTINDPMNEIVDNKRETEKVEEIVTNMKEKPMNEVQFDSATIGSTLLDDTSASEQEDNNYDILNESVGSLLSQVVHSDKQSFTTFEDFISTTEELRRTIPENDLTTIRTWQEEITPNSNEEIDDKLEEFELTDKATESEFLTTTQELQDRFNIPDSTTEQQVFSSTLHELLEKETDYPTTSFNYDFGENNTNEILKTDASSASVYSDGNNEDITEEIAEATEYLTHLETTTARLEQTEESHEIEESSTLELEKLTSKHTLPTTYRPTTLESRFPTVYDVITKPPTLKYETTVGKIDKVTQSTVHANEELQKVTQGFKEVTNVKRTTQPEIIVTQESNNLGYVNALSQSSTNTNNLKESSTLGSFVKVGHQASKIAEKQSESLGNVNKVAKPETFGLKEDTKFGNSNKITQSINIATEKYSTVGEIKKNTQSSTTSNKVVTEPSIAVPDVSNTSESTTEAADKPEDAYWKLVSTVAPHSNSTLSPIEVKPTPVNIQSSKPIELVAQPVQGFSLDDTTANLEPDIVQFVQLCNELAFGFWNSVTTGISSARSVFVSPFAATSLLAMVFLGARGATSGEMNEILKLDDMVTFNPHLIFKNVSESLVASVEQGVATSVVARELYSDKSKGQLLSFYKERARQFYEGHVEEASFREIGDVIRRRTNLIVKRETNGKIPEYVKDSTFTVRPPLAGVSVSIFQTDCSHASTEGRDGELYFVVLPTIRQRRLIPIPAAVWRSHFLAGYEPSLDATAVSLGTPDQTLSTILVIPGQQGIASPGDGLARLERHLVSGAFKEKAWARLLRALIPRPGVEVQVPRFAHRSVINATVALRHMGLKDLFDAERADLRGLNGVANELYLSDIIQLNNFATCGEGTIGDQHHSEIYPATANRTFRRYRRLFDDTNAASSEETSPPLTSEDEPRDYQRAFHDPRHEASLLALPLSLRPRQARIPEAPRLRFDRPFLYFVRHNPTGLLLHMGRFNPRLLP